MSKKFLITYALIIVFLLIIILFVADDKYFVSKNTSNETSINKTKTVPYEEQLKKLLNNKYEYHYDLNHNGITYKCQGKKDKEEDSGTCSEPELITYTQENFQEKLKELNVEYLDVNHIYSMIKDLEPKMTNVNVKRYYTYNVNIMNLKGEIIIYSDLKNITQITIVNGYLTYVLYFDSVY